MKKKLLLTLVVFHTIVFGFSQTIQWTGAIDNVWNKAGNWNPAQVPTSSDNVVVQSGTINPEIKTNRAVNDLLVDGLILTIRTGSLTVEGDITCSASGVVRVSSGASLLTKGSVTGNRYIYTRNTTFDEDTGKYSAVGSPINNANTSSLGSLVYAYDETKPYDNVDLTRYFQVIDVPMPVADGFFSAFTGRIEFIGTFNTGTINVPLVYNLAQDGAENVGYNLVSNPYPSAIRAIDMFFTNISSIAAQLWIWDDDNPPGTQGTSADYITYNSLGDVGPNGKSFNGYIGTAQGFFVKANDPTPTLTFNNNMRRIGFNADANFFRTRENQSQENSTVDAQKVKISLTNTSTGAYSEILFGFLDDATHGFDVMFDAIKENGNTRLQLSSYIDDNRYAIQGRPIVTDQVTVPLGILSSETGNYEFNIEETLDLPEDLMIYIQDTENNSFTKLGEGMPVGFGAGTFNESKRFNIVFTSNSTLTDSEIDFNGKNIEVRAINDKIILRLNNGQSLPSAKITVNDILGRNVLNKTISEPFSYYEINHGLAKNEHYIINVQTESGIVTKKVLIH